MFCQPQARWDRPVSSYPPVKIRVYPDDCDSFGHVNQSSFLRLFERARWETLVPGPGMDVFARHGVWPVVRKTMIEYHASAVPGDLVRFEILVTHVGHTSFSMHGTARRDSDGTLLAEANFVLVCVDRESRPQQVPDEISAFFGTKPALRASSPRHLLVRGVATGVDVLGEGPAILFVHGFPLDRSMWKHLTATLTGWRRIAPDLRGMGTSDEAASGYSVREYADDLAELLDLLQVRDAVICGFSMGGYVAFEFWRRHADRVRALVLVNTQAGADDAEGRSGRDRMIKQVKREGPAALSDSLIPKLLAPSSIDTMPPVVEHVRTMIARSPAGGVIGALQAMKARPDSTATLADISVPTLVVAGKEDQLIPLGRAEALAERIPGAQLTVIPGAGHLAPLEQPVATGRVISEFLEALPQANG